MSVARNIKNDQFYPHDLEKSHVKFSTSFNGEIEPKNIEKYQQEKGELQEEIRHLKKEIEELKKKRKSIKRHPDS